VIGPDNASYSAFAARAGAGTERPRRFRPKLRTKLIGSGSRHEILARTRPRYVSEDELFALTPGGLRWYSLPGCDLWCRRPRREHPARK